MRLLTGTALVVLLFLALPTQAAHCTTWTTSSTDLERGLIVLDLQGVVYQATLVCISDCRYLFYSLTYLETNEIPGLQRGDSIVNDTCHDMIASDTYISG